MFDFATDTLFDGPMYRSSQAATLATTVAAATTKPGTIDEETTIVLTQLTNRTKNEWNDGLL